MVKLSAKAVQKRRKPRFVKPRKGEVVGFALILSMLALLHFGLVAINHNAPSKITDQLDQINAEMAGYTLSTKLENALIDNGIVSFGKDPGRLSLKGKSMVFTPDINRPRAFMALKPSNDINLSDIGFKLPLDLPSNWAKDDVAFYSGDYLPGNELSWCFVVKYKDFYSKYTNLGERAISHGDPLSCAKGQ